MPDLAPWYAARQAMVDALVADLQGSSDADDLIAEAPMDRFVVGILHPRSSDPVEDFRGEDEGDAGTSVDSWDDPGVAFARLRYPSTMGMTFSVRQGTPYLDVKITADRYVEILDPDERAEALAELDRRRAVVAERTGYAPEPEDPNAVAAGTRARRIRSDNPWKVVSIEPVTLRIDPAQPTTGEPLPVTEGLSLRAVVRTAIGGAVSITVVLVNTKVKPDRGGQADGLCWFRPSLRVTARGGAFVDRRPPRAFEQLDADGRGGELLYRKQRHLAVGHGCAVTWDEGSEVTELVSTFFPSHDLAIAKAEPDGVADLGMKDLGASDDRSLLNGLIEAYETWIDGQAARVPSLEKRHRETAELHIEEARGAVKRMRRGVKVLDGNSDAARAFRVMNQVMQQQRVRQEMIRRGSTTLPDIDGMWRPFQMAFILLNLEGLTDPESKDRDTADLLWFPTGGGKTEAYLGLIAFVLVMRRLRGAPNGGAGVGVLMRYTLRLLTVQQFERASGLICALEEWRRRELPAAAEFSIGLWVGQGATPNNVADARKALRKAEDDDGGEDSGNPVQLLRCPWCGTKLPVSAYYADKGLDQLAVNCPNVECDFRRGLPVHLVDTDVYQARPSLVIGTVDKFAMLAWNDRAGSLLGTDGTVDSPDLIVQDELHLISGPLGTLVGLYETAIDKLATGTARPKVVASTATIRRASEQVWQVFARKAKQFPPPGLDASDSFFAVDATPEERGTRRYVGVMAPSTSHATLLVRTYAALLQAGKDLDAPTEVRDAYWTLLGYFNSLRVLGAAFIQSIDDVPDRMKVIAGRLGTEPRAIRDPRELTSRKKSKEIPKELEALQTAYPDKGSPDVVLATNMISVGVDVDRLGLMAVMGQPQTTSEYIQATSRVGRRHPGLVLTMLNASRSRDLSHYESFTSYHRALYKQVEATGATPFASRAIDRGLHGLLVILARQGITGAASDSSVGVPVDVGFEAAVNTILDRVRAVSPEDETEVEEALERLVEEWSDAVEDGHVAKYNGWRSPEKALLTPAGGGPAGGSDESVADAFPVGEPAWPTLTSLRNVDRECTLQIASRKKVSTGE